MSKNDRILGAIVTMASDPEKPSREKLAYIAGITEFIRDRPFSAAPDPTIKVGLRNGRMTTQGLSGGL